MIKHFNIHIWGLVQGVFFRDSTREQAEKLKIRGFVQNLPDGSVYIEAEGEEINLKKFVEFCKQSPPLAKVEKIEISGGPLKNFPQFTVS